MSAAGTVAIADLTRARRRTGRIALVGLGLLAMAALVLSLGTGPLAIAPDRVLAILAEAATGRAVTGTDAAVVLAVRLPRTLAALLAGGALGVAGALMQGLFRNPLADPGLVGVSAGAGLAAALVIVLGDRLVGAAALPAMALPFGAFLGGLATTALLYAVATRDGRTSVTILLLAGIAVSALAGAGTGILVYLSDDRQLRDLTFWSLGSFGGTTWSKLAATGPLLALALVGALTLARALDALVLGEAEAQHLGIPVERMKAAAVVLTALAVGAAVATAGVIGFVGIVVPHLVRLIAGPAHGRVLPASALLGAALLAGADTIARVIVAPAELPIGIVTALIGAPVFLHLLIGRGTRLA